MHKKGQAAMEFLMTYGWAILVVLVAIGALAYFGVLNPSRFLPNSCTLVPGLSCEEFQVAPDGTGGGADVTIIARNGFGDDLIDVNVSLGGDGTACAGTTASSVASWGDGDTNTFTFVCTTEPSGARFKSDVHVVYSKGGLGHNVSGQIVAQVE